MKFRKNCFNTGFHDTIYTFKNYFITVFLALSFQFSTINSIHLSWILGSFLFF